ncbi:MAG: (2Fe-2S) ferredoxin domain-containing protein [Clostridia bacterium]|nr:(2Fe-2S) ferredoxin domain-containing protein [Clostridia bacterium]
MKLLVCVGSSCYLKGSYDVIQKLQELLKKYEVEDQVDLNASFCLGFCASGVTLKSDEVFLHHVNPENVEDVFLKEVYPLLNK